MKHAGWLIGVLVEVEAEKQIRGWGRHGTATHFFSPGKHANHKFEAQYK